MLALDLELRKRRGETPNRENYLDEFPEYEPAIERFFSVFDDSAMIGDETIDQVRGSVDQTIVLERSSTTGSSFQADTEPEVVHEPWRPEFHRLGRYELMAEIGRGGMGVVYKARQMGLNRWVALKTIRTGGMASLAELERFRLEAESAAMLDHPNIVTIHDVGEQFGQSYFTMRLVEGGNLSGRLKKLRDDPEEAARLLATVARGRSRASAWDFASRLEAGKYFGR